MNKEILKYIKTLSDNEEIQKLLIETIGKISLKQNNIEKYIKENEDKIIHIRDWISSIFENDEEWKNPRVLTLDALNNTADKYFEKKNNQLKTIELDEQQEKLIVDLGDYYIVQMLTPEALDNESKIMQHCIGHGYYDQNLKNDEYQYFSLRDKFNKAHVTLEIKNNEVLQMQGKQNGLPEQRYLEILVPYLKEYTYNLDRFMLYYNKTDGKIYFFETLPNNGEIDADLDLYGSSIIRFPENLTINGNLCLKYSYIKELPKGLVIKGGLDLSRTKIKKIPDDIKIRDYLDLSSSLIEELPDNLTINGDLKLNKTDYITKLPKKLNIGGSIIIDNSKIQEIPDDIKIGKNLEMRNSLIERLPDNLSINGDLIINFCKNIKELPKNLTVKGSILCEITNIKEVPNDINIGKSLNLNFSKIEKLPDNLIIHGNLDLSNCNFLNTLPENLVVEKKLILKYTKFKNLPYSLNVNKMEICFSDIEKLSLMKCNEIIIYEDQIDLIKKDVNIDIISVINLKNRITHYSKKDFFNELKM